MSVINCKVCYYPEETNNVNHYSGIIDGILQKDIAVCNRCKEKLRIEDINFDILIEESKVL